MKELQIRNVNQRQINKIVDILFSFCYGKADYNAYKNEFKEDVTEFDFSHFNEENLKKIKEALHEHSFGVWDNKAEDWKCRDCPMTRRKYLEQKEILKK